jgi:hypothetical protein
MVSRTYKTYKKAIRGKVAGRTINRKGDDAEFILVGDPRNPEDDPDLMVIEVYTEDDDVLFRRYNKVAIDRGYLIEEAHDFSYDSVNSVSDGQLKDMLKESKNLVSLRKKVEKFTSDVPVRRLLEFAMEEDRTVKTIEYLKDKIIELSAKPA